MKSILQSYKELGEFAMIPTGRAGNVVKSHLEKAAEAEAEGNMALAEDHMEFAMFIDESRK